MSGGYRITVRGIMSERFCQGFRGLSRRVDAGRTVLSGDPRTAPPLHELLAALANLGLEVVEVEQSHATTAHTPLEA
jgi:hypothetical protein